MAEKVLVFTDNEGKKLVATESAVNGYSKSKVEHAKNWLANHKSHRDIKVEDVVDEYNYLKDTNVSVSSCKSCTLNKYLMGIQNYARMGEKTLRVMGKWEEQLEEPTKALIDAIEEVKDETVESPAEEVKEEVKEEVNESPAEEEVKEEDKPIVSVKVVEDTKPSRAEILAKARAAKKAKQANK